MPGRPLSGNSTSKVRQLLQYLNDLDGRSIVDNLSLSNLWSQFTAHLANRNPHGKNFWQGEWIQQQYYTFDQVLDNAWLMIANKDTTDRAAPQAVGDPYYVYTGTSPTAPATAKQITFGNRYTFNVNGYVRGYRINVVTGNVYSVYSIDDPLGAAIVNQIIGFTADVTGWAEFTISSAIVLAGETVDLMCIVQEPDPTPTTWTGDWVYSKPQNDTIPLAGQITQSTKTLGILNINKTDDNGGDRAAELLALTQGDVIQIATGTRWSIQTFADLGTYVAYSVAPAIQDVLTGLETFTFETVTATPITRMEDVDWWTNNPLPNGTVQGLYGQDIPYESIVPNGSAYGTDLLVQQLSLSDDWDIQAKSDFSSSSGATANYSLPGMVGANTFRDRFLPVELENWAKLNNQVTLPPGPPPTWDEVAKGQAYMMYVISNPLVNLLDPNIIEAIYWLETVNVLAPGRAAIILAT